MGASRIGTKPAISAVPSATIYPKPCKVEFVSDICIAGIKTNRGEALIEQGRFKYGMHFDYKVIHGSIAFEAGRSAGRFYLEGSDQAEVAVQKGSIAHECVRFLGCLDVPDSNIRIASGDVRINLDGIRGAIRVWKYGASFYFDFGSGSLRVPAAPRSRLITSAEIAAAHQTWQAAQQGQVTVASLDHRFDFETSNSLFINTPITLADANVQASNVITDYPINMRRDVIFALVQPITGTLEFRVHTPRGLEITANYLETCDVSTDADCNTALFQQTGGISQTQSIYSVASAESGKATPEQ